MGIYKLLATTGLEVPEEKFLGYRFTLEDFVIKFDKKEEDKNIFVDIMCYKEETFIKMEMEISISDHRTKKVIATKEIFSQEEKMDLKENARNFLKEALQEGYIITEIIQMLSDKEKKEIK